MPALECIRNLGVSPNPGLEQVPDGLKTSVCRMKWLYWPTLRYAFLKSRILRSRSATPCGRLRGVGLKILACVRRRPN